MRVRATNTLAAETPSPARSRMVPVKIRTGACAASTGERNGKSNARRGTSQYYFSARPSARATSVNGELNPTSGADADRKATVSAESRSMNALASTLPNVTLTPKVAPVHAGQAAALDPVDPRAMELGRRLRISRGAGF